MTSPPPRLTRIVIRDLFRSHTVDIPMDREDRVTVLHGRNGSGKTVALTLINALFRQEYEVLCRYPYSSLEVDWDDDSRVEVKSETYLRPSNVAGTAEPQGDVPSVTVTGTSREGADSFTFRPNGVAATSLFKRKRQQRFFFGNSPDAQGSEQIDEELMGRAESKLVTRLLVRQRVVFIETQRLLRIHGPVTPTVSLLADEMCDKIAVASRDFVTVSGRLDGTIANRVLKTAPGFVIPPREVLKVQGLHQERERERLRAIGLLENAETPSPLAAAGEDLSVLEPHDLRILAIILDDQEKKLAVFKDLADSAELMLDVLNRKFAPKRIKLHKEYGYEVTTHDDQPLNLDQLSSGEQHELVLLHKLLFDVPEGTLLLIDEPELSLHVDWQVDFLPDLIRVAEMARFDAILATHSPYIAGDRRDLLVQLGEPVGARA